MRELGKLLCDLKEHDGKGYTIQDCIDPVSFNKVTDAVKRLSGFNPQNCSYGIPSLALKIGYNLKNCAHIIRSQALKSSDEEKLKKAERFLEHYKSDWAHEISSCALNTLHVWKFNKPRRIPLAKDVKKLYDTLCSSSESCKNELITKPGPQSWRELAEVTLAQVSLFNRRRGGEIQRMELEQYQEGLLKGKSCQEEVLESLTPFERKLAETLHRVEIRGKRGRRVPVLLTEIHKQNIYLLLDYKDASGIIDQKYVFEIQSGETLRTSDVLRRYSQECGAEKPDLLTTTSLRKHIGTVCQILNLKENELDALATFMGHDIRVHRTFYRLPEDTYQLAKVSKILLQLENGNISACKGKTLDEIEMCDDEELEIEECEENRQNIDNDNSYDEEAVPVVPPKEFKGKKKDIVRKKNNERKKWTDEEISAVKKILGNILK